MEYENATIQKQRQELRLLIAELKDRDRELNELVSGHRQQLEAWEHDREKIQRLQEDVVALQRESVCASHCKNK